MSTRMQWMLSLGHSHRSDGFRHCRLVSAFQKRERHSNHSSITFSAGQLDNYVQNIHRSCPTNVSVSTVTSSRPKRIRKRKKFYSEESETVVKSKRLRKKAAPPPALLTDAEIEQQFGERLSPTIKMEQNDEENQTLANSRVVIEIEPVPQTPIERARANLIHALGRE
jgi:hypothetical protein